MSLRSLPERFTGNKEPPLSVISVAMKCAICCLLLIATAILGAGDSQKFFDGEISDSQCGFNVHSLNRSHDEMIKTGYMGKNAVECTVNCIRGRGGRFVFVSSNKKSAYKIEAQDVVKDFAGRKVRIRGTLDKDTLRIISIEPL